MWVICPQDTSFACLVNNCMPFRKVERKDSRDAISFRCFCSQQINGGQVGLCEPDLCIKWWWHRSTNNTNMKEVGWQFFMSFPQVPWRFRFVFLFFLIRLTWQWFRSLVGLMQHTRRFILILPGINSPNLLSLWAYLTHNKIYFNIEKLQMKI